MNAAGISENLCEVKELKVDHPGVNETLHPVTHPES